MPTLDVSEVLDSPEFQDMVTVSRANDTVDENGMASVGTPQIFNNVPAVVTFAGPNDIEIVPEATSMAKYIVIVTRFRLRGPASSGQPDKVTYQGSQFKVINLDPYCNYGSGFVEAIAQSIEYVDPAPV
jgi:hypothetical protein